MVFVPYGFEGNLSLDLRILVVFEGKRFHDRKYVDVGTATKSPQTPADLNDPLVKLLRNPGKAVFFGFPATSGQSELLNVARMSNSADQGVRPGRSVICMPH